MLDDTQARGAVQPDSTRIVARHGARCGLDSRVSKFKTQTRASTGTP